jgi:hypothetical protein
MYEKVKRQKASYSMYVVFAQDDTRTLNYILNTIHFPASTTVDTNHNMSTAARNGEV